MTRRKGYTGYKLKISAESIEKIRLANLGKKKSKETIERMKHVKSNENNPMWKGNDVGNNALHEWVNNHLSKPEWCEVCHIRPVDDLANITGNYSRGFNNWQYQCRKCHMKSDGRIEIIRRVGRGRH